MKKERKKHIYRALSCALTLALLAEVPAQPAAQAASKPTCTVKKRTKKKAVIRIGKQSGVTGYQVYVRQGKKGKYKLVMATRTNSYTITGLKPKKIYYVKVRAYKTTGYRVNLGKYSKAVKIAAYKKTSSKKSETSTSTSTSAADTAQTYAKRVLKLVNEEREEAGVAALTLDDTLCSAANVRAKELVQSFDHTRPSGESCSTVLQEYDYSYTAFGENIAAGQSTPKQVVTSWMNSEGHRANILSANYTKMGLGYYKASSGYKYYWAQIFTN
ncbi:MAG: CAP domain-containing protein [Clostridiaceae bacterium]|nr:CAP domain-containing protein [Clostridiaceae bacterium]